MAAATVLLVMGISAAASAQNLRVIPVPWNATDVSIPHQAYNGHATTFKAIARGGDGNYTVEWDFEGDGTFDTSTAVTNRYDLSTIFTYPDEATTITYQAQVRVTSNGDTVTATYPVRIFADVPADPNTASERQLQVMRGVAVDDALWWMHTRVSGRTGDEDSLLTGSQITGFVPNEGSANYHTASTAGLIWAMSLNGHFVAFPPGSYVGTLPDAADNSLRWGDDPYAEDVLRSINWLVVNRAQVITGIPASDESNLVGFFPEVQKAPILGTDDGVGIWMGYTATDQTIYPMGHALSALAVARLDGLVSQVGDPANILGRTYDHLIQQMVDAVVWAQNDTGAATGSWYYTPNQGTDDLSTSLWGLTALWHADIFMSDKGIIVPNTAKTRAVEYAFANARGSGTAGELCGAYRNNQTGCAFTLTAGHVLALGWVGAAQFDAADGLIAFPGHTSRTRGQLRAQYDGYRAFIDTRFLENVVGSLNWNRGFWTLDGTTGLADFTRTDMQGSHYAMLHWQDAARATVPEITDFGGNDWVREFSIYLINNQFADGHYRSVRNSSGPNQITDDSGRESLNTVWSLLVLSPDALPPLAIGQASVATAAEGDMIAFDGSASDPGTGNPTYVWDFGNGDTMNGQNVNYVYPDNGDYTVSLTATSIGGVSTDTFMLSITNVAPTADAGPDLVSNEGDSVPFTVAVTDPGTADTHTYAWDFADGSAVGMAQNPGHVYVDNGTFTVDIVVTDDDLGTGADQLTVVVSNVAPTITSTPGTSATEGTPYAYTITFTDPGANDTHTCSIPTAPAGMTIAGCDISWTPDFTQAVGASAPVQACVTDNDGGQTCQDFSIDTSFTDSDMDGLPDSWEIDNFGDITSQDQFGDPDNDGLLNLQEFTGVTDPNVYDGPAAPNPVDPVCGSEIATPVPSYTVDNAVDPQGSALVYEYQLYRDVGLTLLVAETNTQAEGTAQTTWVPNETLDENQMYYWRARASDSFIAGPWSTTCSFFVNQINEAPGAPGINNPTTGGQVNSFTPTLTIDNAVDPDLDPLTYTYEVYSDNTLQTLVDSATAQAEGTNTSTWTVTATLTEDTRYWWRVRATDDEGLDGDWSPVANFFVTTVNGPPEAPTLLSPQNGTVVNTLSPTLTILNADDSDFDTLVYDFELSDAEDFSNILDSADNVPAQGANNTFWELASALTENMTYCWRARSDDGQATSAWSTACFLVSEVNDPPAVPTLSNPSNSSMVNSMTPTYSWESSIDPEGDDVLYDIEVRDSSDTVIASGSGISGNVMSLGAVFANGETYTWRARAVDSNGAASDFSEPNSFTAVLADNGGDIIVNGSGCNTSGGGKLPTGGMLLLFAVVLGLGRRHRK